jgi:NAD(P)H-flavin reductase/ferredoxin
MASFFKAREQISVTVRPTGKSFAASGKESILNEALAAGIPFPHSCTVGTCGTCKTKLLSGKVRELTDAAVVLSAEELRARYILPCQSLPRTSLELEVEGLADMPDHPLVEAQGRITLQRLLTHDTMEVRLKLDRPLEYTAGQYVELRLPEHSGPRAYSCSVSPSRRQQDQVDFFIRRIPGGAFTEWLFGGDRIGADVTAVGPFGNLWLRPGNAPVLCVAGGSGLAPVKALLEAASDEEVDRDFVLVFGARQERDLYCLKDVERMQASWGTRFRFIPILSDEDPSSTWTGARGLITDAVDGLDKAFLTSCDAYVCGPPPMVDAVEEQLRGMRIDTRFFFADRFLNRATLG